MAKPRWKNAFDERVKTLTNERLLGETLFLAGGDDYDGCFTDQGAYEYKVLNKELSRRLLKIGWLQKEIEV